MTRWGVVFVVLIVSSVTVAQSWTYLSSLPTTRSSMGMASVGGTVYAIGGFLPSSDPHPKPTATVEKWNPITNSWVPVASLIQGRAGFVTTVWNNQIYVIGGKNGGNTLRSIEVYDPVDDEWTLLSNMDEGRVYAFGNAYEDQIYIFGGIDEYGDVTAKIIAYNITTDLWYDVGFLPLMLWGSVSVVIDDLFYITGGASQSRDIWDYGSYNIDRIMIYNPAINNATWLNNDDSKLKYPSVYGCGVLFDNSFYIISGLNSYKGEYDNTIPTSVPYVQYFNPATNKTTAVASVGTAREYFGAAVMGGTIIIAGGQSAVKSGSSVYYTSLSSAESYGFNGHSTASQTITVSRTPSASRTPTFTSYYSQTRTPSQTPSYLTSFEYAWVYWTELQISHNSFTAVTAAGKIYAISGYNTPEVDAYDPDSNSWTTVSKSQIGTYIDDYGATVVNDIIYVFGGGYPQVSACNYTQIYDPVANEWSLGAEMPTPRVFHGAAAYEGLIYLAGGVYYQNGFSFTAYNVDIYNPLTNSWSVRTQIPVGRMFCGITILNGYLYIIGGADTAMGMSNVPRGEVYAYNINSNVWSTLPSLLEPVYQLAATSYGGYVYVTGGVDYGNNDTGTTKVQRYDPTLKKWEYVQAMITPRSRHGLAVLDEQMYAIGGVNSVTSWANLKSVELYMKVH